MKQIKLAIILPTYMETQSLVETLESLIAEFSHEAYYVIVDDSPANVSAKIAEEIFKNYSHDKFTIICSEAKSGRGSAVHRGLCDIYQKNLGIEVVEMDSDGSHSAKDVKRVYENLKDCHFVIGSRYMPGSKIIGWPISRKLFSKSLNTLLRWIFKSKVMDWTNGLRGYSSKSLEVLVNSPVQVSGFMHLSEQILILKHSGIMPREVPIIFKNRQHGTSSVGPRELLNSCRGLMRLLKEMK